MSLFDTGIRPAVDNHLLKLAAEKRDYGDYWSASSAGYCMRKNIFERLGVPHVNEDARKQRVFTAGHIFHEWMQGITRDAGISIAQEVELQDEELMVRGHFDDLVIVEKEYDNGKTNPDHLILYDYKTVNSRAFSWAKNNGNEMSYYHKMQLGTYMYMLRSPKGLAGWGVGVEPDMRIHKVSEARILKISKDDLRMDEQQLMWSKELEKEILWYWKQLNEWWDMKKLPPCTCAEHEGGFMARDKFNPFYYNDEPCSVEWYMQCKEEGLLKEVK